MVKSKIKTPDDMASAVSHYIPYGLKVKTGLGEGTVIFTKGNKLIYSVDGIFKTFNLDDDYSMSMFRMGVVLYTPPSGIRSLKKIKDVEIMDSFRNMIDIFGIKDPVHQIRDFT